MIDYIAIHLLCLRLKISRLHVRAGSIPALGINKYESLSSLFCWGFFIEPLKCLTKYYPPNFS